MQVRVKLWGTTIGYLNQNENGPVSFQFDRDFLSSGIEVSPIRMPLSEQTFTFPGLSEDTFKGLPGLFVDSLPDRFGTTVIARYLESQGRLYSELTTAEKLCYIGTRGIGALEYEPNHMVDVPDRQIDLDALTRLAETILTEKKMIEIPKSDEMMAQLLKMSSSVGGARAKALIAWNRETGQIRSGQVTAGDGYEYWLLKFDGISNNKDHEVVPDDGEHTKTEYAYYLMARDAGIVMEKCRLYEERGFHHFVTRRFDRNPDTGEKVHMLSLGAIAHFDFNTPRVNSYEEAIMVMVRLGLGQNEIEQFYRRMVFNEYAKNYDDHVKNISFLMDKKGVWSLSPAYDVTFSYKPESFWVSAHQMLIHGRAENITEEDLLATAKTANIRKNKAKQIIDEVLDTIGKWEVYAEDAGVSEKKMIMISEILRK